MELSNPVRIRTRSWRRDPRRRRLRAAQPAEQILRSAHRRTPVRRGVRGIRAVRGARHQHRHQLSITPASTTCTTRELHARVLARHRLAADDYRLSQVRYDLAKLRAKGLVERLGRTRRYRLTSSGAKIGVLLVKLRARLLGPLATLGTDSSALRPPLQTQLCRRCFSRG